VKKEPSQTSVSALKTSNKTTKEDSDAESDDMMMCDDDNLANEGSPEDLIEDDEVTGAPASPQKNQNKAEYVALAPFKDLYKHSPVIQMAFEFGQ